MVQLEELLRAKRKKNQFFFSTHYLFTSQLLLFCLKVNEYHMKIVSINTISSGLQWEVDLRYFFPPRKTVHQMDIRECYLMGIWSPFSSRAFFAVSTIFKIRDSHPMVPKAKKSVRAFFFSGVRYLEVWHSCSLFVYYSHSFYK